MPCDYSKYPPDWPSIRLAILERAKGRCERCGVQNYMYVIRLSNCFHEVFKTIDVSDCVTRLRHEGIKDENIRAALERLFPTGRVRVVRIILTIAHLNHNVTDNREENLAALCQLCHNRHDAKYRAENRRRKSEESKA